jgi:ribosomal-protein-alanine N-acetyltransferase
MIQEEVKDGSVIATQRLRLIKCNKDILEAIFEGDAALSALLNITVPEEWTAFGEGAFRYIYDKIVTQGQPTQWWSYLPVLAKTNMLAGSCGYKGAPADGRVEIGYEVAAGLRGQGLATEIAQALIANAFKHDNVQWVQAHTLAEENESGSVLKNCGMQKVEEIEDPEDGRIWRWEIHRNDFYTQP